jgi:proteasome lid subunit RPN8/RPN11
MIRSSCEVNEADYERVKLRAQKKGLRYVGSVHSHPGYDTNQPSEADNQPDGEGDETELVFGIYSFVKNGARTSKSKLCI